ncbi:MAG: PmoA family protein [Cytophagales bacterium]|nr:PmoA family protein [Cytophagales bacterium]
MKLFLKYSIVTAIVFSPIIMVSCSSEKGKAESTKSDKVETKKIRLVRNDAEKKVDVLIEGELFTSYIYPSTIKKPVLYPLKTSKGTKITRGFPLEKVPGERVDHPHHVGMWFNYGDVNGLDFWNNSDSIKTEKRDRYGTIVHKEISKIESGDEKAELSVVMNWNAPSGETLLVENTTFVFRANGNERSIDRITKLTAKDKEVDFKDNKEGVFAIRVTRALEHPSEKPEIFTDANGIATKVKTLNNEGVNGLYYNSLGDEGGDCWGKRAEWVNLTSTIGNEDISLVIMDHPSNVGYPTYWHARTYGLFSANPLGQAVFSKGKDVLEFKLAPNTSATWKHRVLIVSGSKLNKEVLDGKFKAFSAE